MTIGERIRKARLERGLSQQRLADLADISRATVWGTEAGRHQPDLETLKRLSLALGLGSYRDLAADETNLPMNTSEPSAVYSAGTLRVAEVVMLKRFHSIPSDWSDEASSEAADLVAVSRSQAQEGDVLLDVTDDTMEPDYPAGCTVLIDPSLAKPYAGDVIVVTVGEERFLRLVRRRGRELWAIPTNRSYGTTQDVRIDNRADVRVLGTALFVTRRVGRRRR